MSNKRDLKAYVRFDGSGRIVAGSLILRRNKPKVGKWQEILAYECCNPTTTTTTTAPPTPFISVWRTSSPDESITLPYQSTGIYVGTIDWGDGTTSENSYANITHTYAIPGDYTISILGETTKFSFYNTTGIEGNNSKIISVVQWGSQLRLNSTFGSQFISCTNLDLSGVSDLPNLAGATKLNSMFQNCTSLITINRVSEWNVSSVNNMSNMFDGAILFDQNIGNWDVSNVTSMDVMFYDAQTFNQDLSGWCVTLIPTIPPGFDDLTAAWVLPRPIWGTCPA